MHVNGFGLKDLVHLETWQKVQDSFSDVIGITLRTVDLNGKELSRISGPNRLCNKISLDAPDYTRFCGNCPLKTNVDKRIDIKEQTSLKCPLDLDIFILPIEAVANKIVAYIIVGPLILNKRKERAEYASYAKRAGLELDELMDALIEISVFSHSKMRSINSLLSDVFTRMVQTEYHKKRLGEIAPKVVEMDPLFSSYYEEKVLNALLKTCIIAFDVDSGSVMKVDKKSKHLHIKVASKLSEDAIANGEVKMGEGIAGMAALTAEPIILPKDSTRNGIFKKMKRGYIKASLILPFNRPDKDDVYGVLNLNILRKDREFSDKDINLAKELINLASISLIPVK